MPHASPALPTPSPPDRPLATASAAVWALTQVASLAAAGPAQAPSVSPADRETLEGSASTSYPLGRHDCRLQQMYGDLAGPRTLQGHSYRRDALGTRDLVQGLRTELAVTLSSSSAPPNKIRSRFADNVGARPTQVVPRTWVHLPATKRPPAPPANFTYAIPYTRPYSWGGQGSLVVDSVIYGNLTASGSNRNLSASLDSHRLFANGQNLQPGYPFGAGCAANGSTQPARCRFELRHETSRIDLYIDSRWGVPSSAAGPAHSVLLLSSGARAVPWPPGSGCQLYGLTEVVLPLAGANTTTGALRAVLDAGAAPPASFEMNGQILSYARHSWETITSDASRLIVPPPGQGLVGSRLVHGSDRTSQTGTTSTTVPVTLFF